MVNLVLKPLGRRRRPDRDLHRVPIARQVEMPRSTSFPSGHSASAFAFVTGVAAASPAAGIPLSALAALVAYSRVHTGVHYPVDAVVGSVTGGALAPLAVGALGALPRGEREPRGPDPPEAAKTAVVRERSSKSGRDWRPLVLRTSGSATHGVYGLILATAVITISRELDSSDAGRAALSVLVTALVFWLAHVYARLRAPRERRLGDCPRNLRRGDLESERRDR